MRIGFDAKRLFHNHTGLGVYSRRLVEGLAKHHVEHEYLLYAQKVEQSRYKAKFKDFSLRPGKGWAWRTVGLSKDIVSDACDLYHGLSHELPLNLHKRGIKTVVTMHDVIFKVDPDLFPYVDRKIYDLKWRYSCKHANAIIAVSEHTRCDLIELYNVPDEKIRVIYPPVPPPPIPNILVDQSVENKYGLSEPFWLFVGAINPRKNLLGILRAMLISKGSMPLVVVGSGGSYEKKVRQFVVQNGLSPRVRFMGHLPNEELPIFYRRATALIYPSHYEGFGIPLVESLHNGTPVITSNSSSMPEAAGPGAILVDPDSPEDIAEAMSKMSSSPTLRSELSTAGRLHAQRFTTEKVVQHTMNLYKYLSTSQY
ncbi:MAG: glycosyltransferase family 4 protein [Saprospiraceae bacterium]|nr:glycosyltransferase family 4 protein [Saprospiraceae bacterium]